MFRPLATTDGTHAMSLALPAALGLLVGLALGTLGGGGSVLAVPSLVYLLGQTPNSATTGSLVIVIASSLAGLIAHARAGRVHLRSGLIFGLAGLVTSVLSSMASRGLSGEVVLTGFAVVMLTAAAVMWRSATRTSAIANSAAPGAAPAMVGEGTAYPDSIGDLTPGPTPGRHQVRAALAGAGTGVLIGVFGVGGGFLAVPALVAVAGLAMPEAIGTSLLVIVVNSAAALATRIGGADLDWGVIGPFALAASIAAVIGQRLSTRLSAHALQRAFAVVLVLIAGWVLLDQVVL